MKILSEAFLNSIKGKDYVVEPVICIGNHDNSTKFPVTTSSIIISDKTSHYPTGGYKYFFPLLRTFPVSSHSLDINDKKHRISNLKVSLINAKYENETFEQHFNRLEIGSIYNQEVTFWLFSPGVETFNQAVLLFKGIVKDIRVKDKSIDITVEDYSENILSKDFPKRKIPLTG